MSGLPEGKFGVIYADPPWAFDTWSDKGKGRSPERHYPTMTLSELGALPVMDLAAKDCVLFMWATWPRLLPAIGLIGTWGFTYKTCGFLWVKVRKTNGELPVMGTGYWTRANSEPCLLATRGQPRRKDAGVPQVILEPRGAHSAKPAAVRERIQRLVPGPYLELFARQRAYGWESWGNEIA